MYTISIKFVELRILDNLIDLIKIIQQKCNGELIDSIINRNGCIIYLQTQNYLSNSEIIHILQTHKWQFSMEWGSVIKSSSIIESMHINENNNIRTGYIDIIPFTPTIQVSNTKSIDLKNKLSDELRTVYHITNEKFCEYYAKTYTNANIVKIKHTEHKIPISIWNKFANESEHLFIPLNNSELLTASNCPLNSLIGIEALIADVENMIFTNINNFKIDLNQHVYSNYTFQQHINNMKIFINKFKTYLNIDEINEQNLYYYFADMYCSLIQQYPDLRGEITKLIYKDEIIDLIVNLSITNNHQANLIIFCICYDRILWAYNHDSLPSGRGDTLGIKKNIKILIELFNKYLLPLNIFDDIFIQIISNYIYKHYPYRKILNENYISYDINLHANELKIIKRIKGLEITNIKEPHSNTLNEFEHTLLNSINSLDNIHIILNNVNEYLNCNIIKGNEKNEYIMHKIQGYINKYIKN